MSKNPQMDKPKAIDEIIDRISKGESLRAILPQEDRPKHLPALKTFLEWVSQDEELCKQYARATELRADLIFEEMFEIADDGTNDFVEKQRKNGDTYVEFDTEAVMRSRLRIDTRKWALSKMNPKKYSEKQNLDVTTGGDKLTEHTVTIIKKQ